MTSSAWSPSSRTSLLARSDCWEVMLSIFFSTARCASQMLLAMVVAVLHLGCSLCGVNEQMKDENPIRWLGALQRCNYGD
jgi:hypothetical protein